MLTPPVLFVLLLGVFGDGGDWPLATFAIRAVLFLSFAFFLLALSHERLRVNAVDALVAFLWILGAVSLARGGYRWITYQWFLHHSAALCLYLIVRSVPDAAERIPRISGALLLVTAGIQVLFAYFQWGFQEEGRPYGTLQNPNFLAEYLVYAGGAAWILATKEEGNRASRWGYFALLVLLAAGIAITRSRGGFLLVLAVGSYLLAGRVGWRKAALAAALLVAAVMLVPNPLRDRFLGRGDPFAFERINMWKASFRIFLDNPLGVGVGHFKYYWHMARDPVDGSIIRYAKFAKTPHSEFFSVLSELGAPGAIAFLGLGLAGLVSLRRAASRKDPAAFGAVLILFASFLHSFFEYNYHVFGLLLVNAAALAVVSGRLWRPLFEKEVRLGGVAKGFSFMLLGSFLVYSGMTFAGTVLEERGAASFQAGRMEEAERRFLRAAAVDPWRATYMDSASAASYRLFEDGRGTENLFRAIDHEQGAYERNPLDFRFPARLGYLFSRATDHFPASARGQVLVAALSSYDAAIALNPHSADLRYLKAALLKMAGRAEQARELIESTLAAEPRYAKGWVLLGELREAGDIQGAIEAYEQALAVHARFGKMAIEPHEKEFVSMDRGTVETRIRRLRSGPGK